MKSLFITLISFLAIALGLCQAEIVNEQCPPKPVGLTEFDVAQYLGVWYERGVMPYLWERPGDSCNRAKYFDIGGGMVGVLNSGVSGKTGDYHEFCGTAYEYDPINEPGDLVVGFPEANAQGNSSNYWILDTDYTTYVSVYHCEDLDNGTSQKFIWIMSRDPQASAEDLRPAFEAFENNGISINGLTLTPHPEGECVYDVAPSCSDEWTQGTTITP